jgi:hypothetical protein
MPDPKKGTAWQIDIPFFSVSTLGVLTTPTIVAGDITIRKDEGIAANITALPAPVGNLVPITLSATEMNADRIYVVGHDQTIPQEWVDWSITITTTAKTLDDISADVWDQLMENHTITGSFGWAAAEVWNAMRRLKTRLGF